VYVYATTVPQGDDQPDPCPAAARPDGQQREYGVQCVVRAGHYNSCRHGHRVRGDRRVHRLGWHGHRCGRRPVVRRPVPAIEV